MLRDANLCAANPAGANPDQAVCTEPTPMSAPVMGAQVALGRPARCSWLGVPAGLDAHGAPDPRSRRFTLDGAFGVQKTTLCCRLPAGVAASVQGAEKPLKDGQDRQRLFMPVVCVLDACGAGHADTT